MRAPTRQHNRTDALAPICDINEQCLQMLVEAARTSQSADEPFVHQLLSFIKTLDAATGKLLDNSKSPSPRTGELDNRGSQFYLAMYWAQALAEQTEDKELAAHFTALAKSLTENEQKIIAEFSAVQGKPADIGGYYLADDAKRDAVMRPSATFNAILAAARA